MQLAWRSPTGHSSEQEHACCSLPARSCARRCILAAAPGLLPGETSHSSTPAAQLAFECLNTAVASHQDLALQRNAARQPPDRLPDSVLRGMASVFEAPSGDSAAPGLATVTVQTLDIPPENASAVCGPVPRLPELVQLL